jgi:uncharacterized protein with NRDE domain
MYVIVKNLPASLAQLKVASSQEFLHRPTRSARWWSAPEPHILGPQDLFRPAHGTWLGITRQGRVAVLTNYQENENIRGCVSRGAMVVDFLSAPPGKKVSPEETIEGLFRNGKPRVAGGFNMLFGKAGKSLHVVSNRTKHAGQCMAIDEEQRHTVALSNTAFGDRTWRKVSEGERLLKEAIEDNLERGETDAEFITKLLQLLSLDTLPKWNDRGEPATAPELLRESIFIPPVKFNRSTLGENDRTAEPNHCEQGHPNEEIPALCGIYGTMQQTVVLVDRTGWVKYFERTLFDEEARPIPLREGDLLYEFQIEGWGH